MSAAEAWEPPEGWPDKPLHEYSATEWKRFALPALLEHVTRGRVKAPPVVAPAGPGVTR